MVKENLESASENEMAMEREREGDNVGPPGDEEEMPLYQSIPMKKRHRLADETGKGESEACQRVAGPMIEAVQRPLSHHRHPASTPMIDLGDGEWIE